MAEPLSLPQGTLLIADILCRLPSELQEEICLRTAKFVCGKTVEFDTNSFVKTADLLHCNLKPSELESVTNGVQNLFRTALQQNLNGEQLVNWLQTASSWSESTLNTIRKAWSQEFGSAASAAEYVSIGRLVDFDWKLGMAMSSASCRNLDSPFVTVVLRVAQPSGKIDTRSFEMTVPEFQNFASKIRDLAHALESA